MRPIDADKVLNDMMRLKHSKEYSDVDEAYDYGIDGCIDEVSGAELVDVEPVVHAHWYFDPDKSIGCGITVSGMFCSNCGGDCPTGSHPYRDFKYCPHCGARMDEDK